ncbi:uncharacterized protein YbjT (DUF2867 family) [Nocardia tenerifensis]|uniref:Uncharacterized protein YbjT (DUF2867 family) n=2 Tax=Nocardia tenerifensis TaxID=228006 RepID=A0A318JW00_9NOCA|nr:NmrA family NAD(P)-binding protein [Nocardia tenerifensis]PXX57643.1 uncharacterized protein YbjT (DUF2867 family) [Nocardia tenerifensis]
MTELPADVLVTGATGRQGGAVATALLDAGRPVRVLVRDAGSARARALATKGALLVHGDLNEPDSLHAAMSGIGAVLSVQTPDITDLLGDSEDRHNRALVEAARAAGVRQLVHTSVSGAGMPGRGDIDPQHWGEHMRHYWRSKISGERRVREAGFEHWTILRPAIFMENFVRPSFYFAEGVSNRLLFAVDLDVPLAFVTVRDIGTAAAAAFADPARFHAVELDLAGDLLTFRDAAQTLSEVTGTQIELPASPEAAIEAGLATEFARSQQFTSAHPAPARASTAHQFGLPTTSFTDWARETLG